MGKDNFMIGPSTFWAHSVYKPTDEIFETGKPVDDCLMQWPEKTDICCWNCCHPFSTVPLPIPTNVDSVTGRFTPYGIFCSFQCAKRYILEHPDSATQNNLKNLSVMAQNVFDYTKDILPAPRRIALKMFGGYLDIEDYRKKCNSVEVLVHIPPFVTSTMIFEEKDILGKKLSEKYKQDRANGVDENDENDMIVVPRPTNQVWNMRHLRAPKEPKISASNKQSRVVQRVSEYQKYYEMMQGQSLVPIDYIPTFTKTNFSSCSSSSFLSGGNDAARKRGEQQEQNSGGGENLAESLPVFENKNKKIDEEGVSLNDVSAQSSSTLSSSAQSSSAQSSSAQNSSFYSSSAQGSLGLNGNAEKSYGVYRNDNKDGQHINPDQSINTESSGSATLIIKKKRGRPAGTTKKAEGEGQKKIKTE